jgi:hypothetical protein
MRTLVASPHESRFTPIAELARSLIDAPPGPDGAPCVFAGIERVDGRCALVARTCDDSQATRLLLPDTDPQRVQDALDYLTERLTAIGLVVLEDEAELAAVH